MQPSNRQVFVSQPYLVVTPSVTIIQTPSKEKLSGYKARSITGGIQIICGLLEIAFGIAVIIIPLRYSVLLFGTRDANGDNVGWGIWNGVFAVVTGVLGCCSRRYKSVVVYYMLTSIIATVSSVFCLIWGVLHISRANRALPDYDRVVNLAMYSVLSIAFAVHMVTSLIGAIFCCSATSYTNTPHQTVYSVSQMPLQQAGPLTHCNYPRTPEPPPPYIPLPPSYV
ncbi:hypothetical protein HOLleu_19719 [Holothuria leucospilota]|uniref:Uncharacterized protein n=1 Tax=Holothuria leucospilota TaxID=206669 RepID=A0A9Q1C0C5_HOLLE|nr:hypothetical protein HOLleu_19719 [Holothuria leucospilota]